MNNGVKPKFQLSISRFLLIGVLSFTVIYFVAIYTLSQRQAIHEIEELFDAQLAHSSYILMNLLSESVSTIDQNNPHLPIVYFGVGEESLQSANAFFYQKKVAYQIYNDKDKLLIVSGSAPDARFANKTLGYSSIDIDGETWRVFSLYDDDWKFWLHVAESAVIREEMANEIATQTLWPGIALLPFSLILLTLIIRFALRPIKQLAQRIQIRDPKNLSAIELTHTPKEMEPVLQALNTLFERLNDAITREKRLTADAAHELRTPLSVIMIHAQNAIAAKSDEERDNSLRELEVGVKRVSRLLDQLLTLSKVSPETIPVTDLSIYPLCQEIMAQMALPILEKNQECELVCSETAKHIQMIGSEFLLEILLRNLIDNAREYSPENGFIRLTILEETKESIALIVEDSGPGVAPEHYQRISDRFYREHQSQGKGAGLGLFLVKNIVEFHKGELSFNRSQLGGLAVKVRLPKNKEASL